MRENRLSTFGAERRTETQALVEDEKRSYDRRHAMVEPVESPSIEHFDDNKLKAASWKEFATVD